MARGRKPKPESKKRKPRPLSFNDDEYERFGELAKQANLSRSGFARRAIFGIKITSQVDIEAVKEIRRIGVNINQIAKIMNQHGRPKAEAKLREILKTLMTKMDEII